MRILYFSHGYTPHDYRFLTALSGTEHDVFFLRLKTGMSGLEDHPLPERIRQASWRNPSGTVSRRLNSATTSWMDYFLLRRKFREVVCMVQPDLVHAGPIQQSAFLAALSGFHPLVTMSWGSDLLKDARRNRTWRWVTRFTLQRSDVLVGDCQAVADEAGRYGFSPEKIVLFPWGVDLKNFQPGRSQDFIRRLGWQDCFISLCTRSWEPIYGVDHLVRGFVTAAQRNPKLRLLLLGGGTQAALLTTILMDAGMLERVHFGGQVRYEDLLRYYQAADLYVSASHSDGSSVSLMEALACGLPVLVSDISGNREWVQPGRQGWLFADGDERQIAAGILKAYGQRGQLREMGQASRALAEERADWSKNFLRLLQAYEIGLLMGTKHG